MSSKHFTDIISTMKEIHEKKSHDYASTDDPFSNFKRAAIITSWFTNDIDKTFANILGIKFARLAELLSTGKTANNESIDDTFIDAANYVALWCAFYRNERELNEHFHTALATSFKKVEVKPQGEFKSNGVFPGPGYEPIIDDDIPF